MKDEYTPFEINSEYQKSTYQTKQMRDTVAGSIAVKNEGELYLPMPGAWNVIKEAGTIPSEATKNAPNYLPWTHKNPAYRAYIQRARFPDITANALRMCVGIATLKDPELNIPSNMDYLEKTATNSFDSIYELYVYVLSEILTVGKTALVVDFDVSRQQFYITTYSRENFANYKEGFDGVNKIIFSSSFYEDEDTVIEYTYNDSGKVCARRYKDGNQIEEIELKYRGVDYASVPVFYSGASDNTPKPNTPPLLGISDIAISLYQTDADLRQAQFMTCNPTLFVFGVDNADTPTTIGSQVIVGIRNPNGRAEYPRTDTSALEHIRNNKSDMMQEAAGYGAALVSSPSKEAAEALSIRQANRGASLVNSASMAGKAINDALAFIANLMGVKQDEAFFDPNVEFAETVMTSQDLTALVSAWMSGAITHDILLDNLRDAGWIDSDGDSNDEIKDKVEKEKPTIDESLITKDSGDNFQKKDKQNNQAK